MVRMVTLMVPLLLGGSAAATPASATDTAPGGTVTASQSPAVVVFFGHGEQIFDVGPLPDLGKAAKKKAATKGKKRSGKKSKKKAKKRRTHGRWLDGYRAGYRCQVLLIFWAYVHRWGCKPAVFQGKTYLRSAMSDQTRGSTIRALEKAIAEKYKPSDHKLGWWARNGRWVLGGILLLLILSGIMKRMRRRRY